MENGSIRIIDAHAHYAWPTDPESLIAVMRETGTDAVALAALPGGPRLDPTPDILALKCRYPTRIFAFGCLDCTDYRKRRAGLSRRMIARAKQLLAAGCDGVKLLEGKPTMRRAYPIPDFDDPALEGFWAYAEETRLPLLWHVNDPAAFWDASRASDRAKEQGWVYSEGFVKDSEQYRQVRAVLERHERLNVCFAHCFFLSAQLPRLSEWMARFPLMRVDLTPAIEVFMELSETPAESRAFLEAYQDRIQYGTDIGGRAVLSGAPAVSRGEALRRTEIARGFLMGKGASGILPDGEYLTGTASFVLRGMGLPQEILQKIFSENFLAFVGRDTPAPVSLPRAEKLARHTLRAISTEARRNGRRPDLSGAQAALDQLILFGKSEEEDV